MSVNLKDKEAIRYIIANGGIEFLYSSLVDTEEKIILALKEWFDKLANEGYYDEEVTINAVFNREKAKTHQIIVECNGQNTVSEGFAKNKQDIVFNIDGIDKYYISISGQFNLNCEIRCISTSRKGVSRIADAVYLGLNTELHRKLASFKMTIPPNGVSLAGKIRRVELVTNTGLYEITLNIRDMRLDWEQILENEGEILKGFQWYITQLTE